MLLISMHIYMKLFDKKVSYIPQHSTVMHTGADKEIASHSNEKGNKGYVCMLDTSKLFSLLNERNIAVNFASHNYFNTCQNLSASWNYVIYPLCHHWW